MRQIIRGLTDSSRQVYNALPCDAEGLSLYPIMPLFHSFKVFLWIVLISFCFQNTHGFALLGPFEPWQTPELGYNPFGDEIGAPKDIDEEYRWNVPEITWGVDRAFFEYFGTNGVRAVSEAFAVFNNLPPASKLNVDDFLSDPRRINARAEATNLVDLKSTVMALVVEQLGLASPDTYTWTLEARREYTFGDPPLQATNYLVINRNFDPQTFTPSIYVNGVRYTYRILEFADPQFADVVEDSIDPGQQLHALSAVASFSRSGAHPFGLPIGIYLTALSQDDAGGFRYLLHPANVNIEPLPLGSSPADADAETSTTVGDVLRPGVDKIQFSFLPGDWETTPGWSTNLQWTDNYYLGGVLHQQQLKRVLTRPDIVFSAADLGLRDNSVFPKLISRTIPHWLKSSAAQSLAGPSILGGPVTITFAKLGPSFYNTFPGYTSEASSQPMVPRWGSFSFTEEIVIYPQRTFDQPGVTLTSTNLGGFITISVDQFAIDNAVFNIESSVNLREWRPTAAGLSATNSYRFQMPASSRTEFFRAVRVQ
jgi:hypothetical protein